MPDTKQNDKADLAFEAGEKIHPPFTEAERDRITRLVDAGMDPIDAGEAVLDERIALAARSVRARDGDPYPPLESLLSASVQKQRASRKVERAFGDTSAPTPDEARELAALQAAQEENEELRKTSEANAAELERLRTELSGAEALRQRTAELEAENERLRASAASGDATPSGEGGSADPGPAEQTGELASSTTRIDGKKGDRR